MPEYLKDLMKKVKETKEQEIAKGQEVKKEEDSSKEKADENIFAEEKKFSDEQKEEAIFYGAEEEKFTNDLEKIKKVLIDSYGNTKIYKLEGESLLLYTVPVPRPSAAERATINTIKEIVTRLVTISPYRIRDERERRTTYYKKVIEILKESTELKVPPTKWDFYADAVVREMVGYGLIDPLVRDDNLEEIMVIGAKKPVYVFHRKYEMMLTNVVFFTEKEIQDLINRIAASVGRRVDLSSPLLDARLADGSRVNATIPPASVDSSTLTIRKFKEDPFSVIDLIDFNTLSTELAAFLWLCVEGLKVKPANILIAGGTGSGKTTLLNVLSSFIPSYERIISIEDTAELNLPLKHWIRMEARPPTIEGTGEISLDILTKNALRMRPDRIIVGEVRHAEAFSLFTAMNTGHQGSMGTIHANSADETIVRIISPPMNVPVLMLSGLDLIIVESRIHDKRKGTIRRIVEIGEVVDVLSGKPKIQQIYIWDPVKDNIEKVAVKVKYLNDLQQYTGLTMKQIEAEVYSRANFLDNLRKQGIRNVVEVSRECEKYLLDKKG
ncbi:MAG: ATPase, T2SS/T4P/T4SS family [Candidatus Diapherotrites archaeon]|nr:ATPase, T2SS/T4P/T4SS family [Candidatus Diapherotrites archaeon]